MSEPLPLDVLPIMAGRPFTRAEAPQVMVRGYRVDLAFVRPIPGGRRLALEYDSDLWHGSPRQQKRDARRSRRIEAEGWVTLSVGRGQVWGTDPALEHAAGDLLEVRPRLPRRW